MQHDGRNNVNKLDRLDCVLPSFCMQGRLTPHFKKFRCPLRCVALFLASIAYTLPYSRRAEVRSREMISGRLPCVDARVFRSETLTNAREFSGRPVQ